MDFSSSRLSNYQFGGSGPQTPACRQAGFAFAISLHIQKRNFWGTPAQNLRHQSFFLFAQFHCRAWAGVKDGGSRRHGPGPAQSRGTARPWPEVRLPGKLYLVPHDSGLDDATRRRPTVSSNAGLDDSIPSSEDAIATLKSRHREQKSKRAGTRKPCSTPSESKYHPVTAPAGLFEPGKVPWPLSLPAPGASNIVNWPSGARTKP